MELLPMLRAAKYESKCEKFCGEGDNAYICN